MTTLKTLEIWTAQTICDVGIMLSIVRCRMFNLEGGGNPTGHSSRQPSARRPPANGHG